MNTPKEKPKKATLNAADKREIRTVVNAELMPLKKDVRIIINELRRLTKELKAKEVVNG